MTSCVQREDQTWLRNQARILDHHSLPDTPQVKRNVLPIGVMDDVELLRMGIHLARSHTFSKGRVLPPKAKERVRGTVQWALATGPTLELKDGPALGMGARQLPSRFSQRSRLPLLNHPENPRSNMNTCGSWGSCAAPKRLANFDAQKGPWNKRTTWCEEGAPCQPKVSSHHVQRPHLSPAIVVLYAHPLLAEHAVEHHVAALCKACHQLVHLCIVVEVFGWDVQRTADVSALEVLQVGQEQGTPRVSHGTRFAPSNVHVQVREPSAFPSRRTVSRTSTITVDSLASLWCVSISTSSVPNRVFASFLAHLLRCAASSSASMVDTGRAFRGALARAKADERAGEARIATAIHHTSLAT